MNNYKPCTFTRRDEETGKISTDTADVICSQKCASCGFNPAEARRRIRTGKFVEFTDGTRRLIFKRRDYVERT